MLFAGENIPCVLAGANVPEDDSMTKIPVFLDCDVLLNGVADALRLSERLDVLVSKFAVLDHRAAAYSIAVIDPFHLDFQVGKGRRGSDERRE